MLSVYIAGLFWVKSDRNWTYNKMYYYTDLQ